MGVSMLMIMLINVLMKAEEEVELWIGVVNDDRKRLGSISKGVLKNFSRTKSVMTTC